MLFDSQEPITVPCARTVEPAIHSLLRLGIMQEEFVDHVSRALGIVRCVLDHEQSIPRSKLAALGRSLWARAPHIPSIPEGTVEQVRSIIMTCVGELRDLADAPVARADADLPLFSPASASLRVDDVEDLVVVQEPQVTSTQATAAVVTEPPPKSDAQEWEGFRFGTRGLFGTLPPRRRYKDAFNRTTGTAPSAPRPSRPSHRQRSLFDAPLPNQAQTEPAVPLAPPSAIREPPPPVADTALPALPIEPTITDRAPLRVDIASGERAKARDIVAAVALLKSLEHEGRSPGSAEREQLAKFAGFGPVALSVFPNPLTGRYKDAAWQQIGGELESLLTPAEYESAKRTTFNAFYTSPVVITAIHSAISRLGVPTDAAVLEPGCGIGNFLSMASPEMRCIGVELDSISGRIARQLHPGCEIRIENFRDTRLPEGSIDAVIGNVPFADLKMDYRGRKFSLHDFFLAKSVDALRPGGVLAAVTSHFTLDKQGEAAREYLALQADFIGAIRLPSDAFKRQGTSVVTDILFLRRRTAFDPPQHADSDWLAVERLPIDGVEVLVNRYFLNHPETVLGTWTRKDSLYGEGYAVAATGDLATQLADAIDRLPQFPPLPRRPLLPTLTDASPSATSDQLASEASFLTDEDGTICQWLDGQAVPVVYAGVPLSARGTLTGRRMAALIGLKNHARRVLQSQNEEWPEARRNHVRFELNFAYDRFTALYGPINKTTFGKTKGGGEIRRMPNLVKFREDPDAMLVMSLEIYDESTGKANKSAIMTQDVVGRIPPVTSVQTAEEGLLVCLNQRGEVDLAVIADLYGKPEENIVAELGDLVYRDPETQAWQTADAYLSGNVRAKLAAALKAGSDYARNADALAAVQPDDVLPGDIDCNLGAPWIPAEDIRSFAAELFRVDAKVIEVGRLAKDAVWSIAVGAEAEASVAATSEYGTPRASGVLLLDLALNMKTPVIYDTVMRGDREERVVNDEETLAAREKQRQIKEYFRSWIFSDHDRTERLVRLYNDTFNNLRPRLFDGSHLDFPGMNQVISLMSHQRAAVWRCMCAGSTLLAQTVGAGKTFIMAAAGMKMKQAGLIRKPLYVVPNHMLEQFGREFLLLYPDARLLIAGKDDLARDRRKLLTAKIASGEWDGIVVTHSSFERIGMSSDSKAQFLRDQIDAYSELLRDTLAASDRAGRNLIKTIEKQKARHEERPRQLLAERKKDDGLVFDELGIDYLFIDEAQYCKNLETPSKMQRVAGIQTGGSERAFDLFMKTRFLYAKHPGHGVAFATGTPISNTMVEMYTMQRYLDPAGMEERGIDHFDAWAATFGEVVDAMEISPDGASLRPRSRFAKFTNLPELQQMFRSYADVQTADMLDLPRPALETGKAQVVACPMSTEQRALQEQLVERYERLRSERIHPSVDNALAITTDGRKLALESRLLDGAAPDFSGSKVNALIARVLSIWQRTTASRSTQLVFCDLGVHATATGYSVYDDVVEKLRAGGMTATEIAAIGDADSDGKKQALFERVRSGSVRVLLGSTQKMGMGTNVQKRLIALHHLDAPWKPAEVEQREGRILRQGNDNPSVAIYRYVTEGSFDAFMWQALETKARFIAQVMTGQAAVRRSDDVGSHELSYAEVKAIASGNPAVLTLAESDSELQRLAILKKNHADEQYLATRRLRDLPTTIAQLKERLSGLEADGSTVIANADRSIVIVDQGVGADAVVAALGRALESLPPRVGERRRIVLGRYRGLAFGMNIYPHFPPEVFLEGATCRSDALSRDHHGPRAVLNALERLGGSYEPEAARARQNLAIAEAQLRDYQGRSGEPFAHEAYLTELTSLRDALRSCLSGTSKARAGETGPTMRELTERIKGLRALQTIDATTQRTSSPRGSTAAEPITERIRRRIALAVTA